MKELILVVDDQELNVKLLRVLLENRGYAVAAAGDAEQAWIELRAAKPALILMDIQLPGTSGLQLTRELKVDPAYSSIPIIAVTSFAMKGDAEKILAAGCDGYVSKPIDRRLLLGMIQQHLLATG